VTKHRNDIYSDDISGDKDKEDIPPAIPAATVLLLRDHSNELQVLMLHKTSKIAFGGMWVFPGGKIDVDDYVDPDDHDTAARQAAARETTEEAGIEIPTEAFVWFAHWTPPPSTAKRFTTWFFVTEALEDHEISIDGGEIQNHQWVNPATALEQHRAGEIDLAPPTWVSLYQLSKFQQASAAIETLAGSEPRYYQTRLGKDDEGNRIAMWSGDAGYEPWDATLSGDTHRLVMRAGGFEFLHSSTDY
jgi:8-oxo-dGTP pyrophosphatase MutT (NUDIX family)